MRMSEVANHVYAFERVCHLNIGLSSNTYVYLEIYFSSKLYYVVRYCYSTMYSQMDNSLGHITIQAALNGL
jgi:hypothetical protein